MNQKDLKLIQELNSLSIANPDYWSFRGNSKRENTHALLQYPAMMVPQMQGALIDAVLQVESGITSVFDPFVGSGTTLGEVQNRGLDFYGSDINPLAVLSCQVKSGPFYIKALRSKADMILSHISSDRQDSIEVDFFGIDKWFTKETQRKLSKIRRAILTEDSLWARRLFWLTLSSTVRATCNSRSSTYKLHIKKAEDISRAPCAINFFQEELLKNVERLQKQKEFLKKQNLLSRNSSSYAKKIEIYNRDIRNQKWSKSLAFDFLISSPPYGDNQTTVPYGQFSYLALQWLNVNDINPMLDSSLLSNQNAIDSNSLGGSLKESKVKSAEISTISSSFEGCISSTNKVNPNSAKKIASFFYDLNQSLSNITSVMNKDGYMIWTVGNRRVANMEVPFNMIFRELCEFQGCHFVHEIQREIPSKRMASKNNKVNTMTKESILIMRKK